MPAKVSLPSLWKSTRRYTVWPAYAERSATYSSQALIWPPQACSPAMVRVYAGVTLLSSVKFTPSVLTWRLVPSKLEPSDWIHIHTWNLGVLVAVNEIAGEVAVVVPQPMLLLYM